MKKTQAQTFSARGLDYSAQIVYYTIKRRRKATHTKRLGTMTYFVKVTNGHSMKSHELKTDDLCEAMDQAEEIAGSDAWRVYKRLECGYESPQARSYDW